MREILDKLSVGLVIVSEDGTISFANSFCKERGIVPQGCEGKKYYEVFKSLELIGFVNDLLEGKGGTLRFELNGSIYEAKALGKTALEIQDITQPIKFEKARREFIASVSHELSTPLTAVKGLLETLMLKDPPDAHILKKVLKRLEDLEKLINSLRFLILLDTSQKVIKDRVSVKALIERILEELNEEIKTKRLTVTVEGGDLHIDTDREKLYILLKNIIENAVRYNKLKGSILIKIEAKRISVKDTGEGIPKEDIPLIFQPFFGGKNKKGMGLGLAISKKIADFLGADLRISSKEGKGTTVEVLLP